MIRKGLLLLPGCLLIPSIIYAHGGHGNGILAGFTHPIFGLDHLIAIVGFAIFGTLFLGGKWYFPVLLFIIGMVLGGLFGINKEANEIIEIVIAISSIVVGLAIFVYKSNQANWMMASALIFGAVHGFAHGAEKPELTTAIEYITGYVIGTALISVIGYLVSKNLINPNSRYADFVGGIITGCGLIFLFG